MHRMMVTLGLVMTISVFMISTPLTAGEAVNVAQKKSASPQTAPKGDQAGKSRFTVNSLGIITDSSTGLQWYPGPDKDTDWDQASAWAKSLKVDGGGWRLPTIEELRGIHVNMGKAKVGLNHIAPVFKLGKNAPDKFKTPRKVWSDKVSMGGAQLFDYFYPDGNNHISHRGIGSKTRAFAVRSGR